MGGDLSVVNAARVSFAQYHNEMQEGDDKLIGYLLKHKHGTPFEHNMFTFNVKLPLFIAREWVRHRIGSFNEVSMRYTKITPEFYIPDNVRKRVGKPGAYTYEQAEEYKATRFRAHLGDCSRAAAQAYEGALDMGVAPEQARLFLPVNVYTQWVWTINARALMNFLALRNASTAQWEIQQYAIAVEEQFEHCMPVTHAAFVENGRIAP